VPEPLVEILCILDRSGSMESIRDDAVGGFNAFLDAQREVPGQATLTLVLFDHEYLVVHEAVPLEQVPSLSRQTFQPRGQTALRAENASRTFSRDLIFQEISVRQAAGWQFLFLAANQDAIAAGGALGIRPGASIRFDADRSGTRDAFRTVTHVVTEARTLVFEPPPPDDDA
jgi:hypothetical protein